MRSPGSVRLALLLALCVSAPASALGQGRVQVLETDPGSPAALGHWHRFNVRFAYESDRPIRVHGETYWQGRKVTSMTGGAPVYPAGAGEGMFWFAYTEPAQVDRFALHAYEERGQTAIAQAALDVTLRWTGEKGPRPTPAAWVTRMDAEAERRQREAYQAYMNRPTPIWERARSSSR